MSTQPTASDRDHLPPEAVLQRALRDTIRTALAEDGASQADLCRHVGITPKHMSQILNGRASATVALWSRLLVALGICSVELPWTPGDPTVLPHGWVTAG